MKDRYPAGGGEKVKEALAASVRLDPAELAFCSWPQDPPCQNMALVVSWIGGSPSTPVCVYHSNRWGQLGPSG